MVSREKRLHEVFEHLRKFFGIHTQTDFAVALKYSRVYISSALNGNEKNLTDKLFENICEAYPGVFNLNYLLTGEGQLLTIEEDVKSEDIEKAINPTSQPQAIDYTFLIEKAVEKATAYADKTIAILEKQVATLEKDIESKDTEISTLKDRLHEFEIATTIITPGQTYPFEVGVSETKDQPSAKI